MVNRQTYAEAKKLLDEIHHELQNEQLTPKQRKELELHSASLAGVLCSPWLPVAWPNRIIMAAIFLFGLQQAATGNYEPLVWWLLLPFFSPRIMGEAAFLLGRLSRLFQGG